MRAAYLDVSDGCAGDMICGSLVACGLDMAELRKQLRRIPLTGYTVHAESVRRKSGHGHLLRATLFRVVPRGKAWDDHTSYRRITALIEHSGLDRPVKDDILRVFDVLGRAESRVHGESLQNVSFHEVGQVDAIVEIATAAIGLRLLGINTLEVGRVGLSRPAPATLEILKGFPVVFLSGGHESATPTGTAIVRALGKPVEIASPMVLENSGCGAGTREDPPPNLVRLSFGSTPQGEHDVLCMETTLDDFNPALFEHLMERLFAAGALDVRLLCGQGKKNRPVFDLRVLAPVELQDALATVLFEESTTLGLRLRTERRVVLRREFREVETRWGRVPVKLGYMGSRCVNASPEYQACRKIAREHGVALKNVFREVSARLKNPR